MFRIGQKVIFKNKQGKVIEVNGGDCIVEFKDNTTRKIKKAWFKTQAVGKPFKAQFLTPLENVTFRLTYQTGKVSPYKLYVRYFGTGGRVLTSFTLDFKKYSTLLAEVNKLARKANEQGGRALFTNEVPAQLQNDRIVPEEIIITKDPYSNQIVVKLLKGGEQVVTSAFRTQDQAQKYARTLSRNHPKAVVNNKLSLLKIFGFKHYKLIDFAQLDLFPVGTKVKDSKLIAFGQGVVTDANVDMVTVQYDNGQTMRYADLTGLKVSR